MRKSRAALQRALVQLIEIKSYDTITVEDVAGAADVARATFYAHYRDKAELLQEVCGELIADAAERAVGAAPGERTDTPMTYSGTAAAAILRHAGEHAHLYRLVLTGAGGEGPRRQLIATLEAAVDSVYSGLAQALGRTPPIPMSVTVTAFTGALLAVIESWLDGQLGGTPEEVAATFMQGQVEGLAWSIGSSGEFRFVAPEASDQ